MGVSSRAKSDERLHDIIQSDRYSFRCGSRGTVQGRDSHVKTQVIVEFTNKDGSSYFRLPMFPNEIDLTDPTKGVETQQDAKKKKKKKKKSKKKKKNAPQVCVDAISLHCELDVSSDS